MAEEDRLMGTWGLPVIVLRSTADPVLGGATEEYWFEVAT